MPLEFSESFISALDKDLLIRGAIAVLLVVAGIFLGKFVKFVFRRIFDKILSRKFVQAPLLDLFFVVIKWSIYLTFIYFALRVLQVSFLLDYLTTILLILPTLTVAVVLVLIGYGLAGYLYQLILESELGEKVNAGKAVYLLVIYLFLFYAIKTALISQSPSFTNLLLIIYSAAFCLFVVIQSAKKYLLS